MESIHSQKQVLGHDHYIKTLDGWRAIAVILVTLSHLRDAVLTTDSFLYPFFSWGLNGVDLFFALSGYLISIKLIFEIEKSKTIDLKKFYVKRFFRLMPASWFYLFVLGCFAWGEMITVHAKEFISTLTFWRNYLYSFDSHTYTGQFWSLSVEEHFYFFLPAFLLVFKRPRKIVLGLLVIACAVTVWRKLGTHPGFIQKFPAAKYDIWGTFGRFDALLYGVLLAYIQTYYLQVSAYLKKVHPFVVMAFLFVITYFPVPLRPTWEAILFPLLIYSTLSREESMISKFLEMKPLKYLGTISYSFYIWQQFFVFKMHDGPSFLQAVTGEWHSLIFIFIASAASYHFIETPMRRLGYRFVKRERVS